jgi:hypothetical protein
MSSEPAHDSFPIKVFADEAETRMLLRVTTQGEVQVTDDMTAKEAETVVVRLAKMVFLLHNAEAVRREEEKLLDEQIGTRSKMRQEILRLKSDISEMKQRAAERGAK